MVKYFHSVIIGPYDHPIFLIIQKTAPPINGTGTLTLATCTGDSIFFLRMKQNHNCPILSLYQVQIA